MNNARAAAVVLPQYPIGGYKASSGGFVGACASIATPPLSLKTAIKASHTMLNNESVFSYPPYARVAVISTFSMPIAVNRG